MKPISSVPVSAGEYLGAAHTSCNIKRLESRKIVLYAHNLSGSVFIMIIPPCAATATISLLPSRYDSHFLFQCIGQIPGVTHLSALPSSSTEKFRTFRMNNYCFVDSSAFAQASLSDLVENLKNDSFVGGSRAGHQFKILDQLGLYKVNRSEQCLKQMLIRKGKNNHTSDRSCLKPLSLSGCFPYEACTSLEYLEQTTQIPPIEDFYSALTNSTVSEEDHAHAVRVFKAFRCRNLKDFCEIYCMTGNTHN